MMVIESAVSAFQSVFSNKMRSILTMLGIIIGISSVIMITSIGKGFQESINSELSKLGMVGLQVMVNYDGDVKTSDLFTLEDLDVIKSHPQVANVAPIFQSSAKVALKNPHESQSCYLFGTNEEYRFVQHLDVKYGRFLMSQDIENNSAVVVIDESVSKKIFGRADSVGDTIQVTMWFGSMDLTVVGVLKAEEQGAMFTMPVIMYLPITTVLRANSQDTVDYFFVSAKSTEGMDRTAEEIGKLLSIKHNNENKYYVQNLVKQMDSINTVINGVTAFVGLVAAISLIVGGIGVMNIMLVTVTERTHEIGIRKSLGATDGNIQFQFLLEAMILTAIGGVIGICVGYFGGYGIGGLIDITPSVSIPTVVGTVVVSSLIGIVFGVYPAGKAAKLDPIEALRYE